MSRRLDLLTDALKHLAAPAEEQIRFISDSAFHADELALDFDAIAAASQDMLHCNELTTAQVERTQQINQKLAEMSGPTRAGLWTHEGLIHAPEWAEIRMLAQRCLREFGID